MKNWKKILLLGAVLLIASPAYAFEQAEPEMGCTVVDPTGTPLNIRAAPNAHSAIVGKLLGAGNTIFLRPQLGMNITLGWVFYNYLVCDY